MRIKKIHLSEYKRFLDLTIDLGENPARIVALVGPNGCGKSSVFDAILYEFNQYGRIGGTRNRDYNYHSLLQDPQFNSSHVEIMTDIGNLNSIIGTKMNGEIYKKMVSFRSSFRYNGSLDVREVKAVSGIEKNDFGATTAADIDQRIEQSYKRLQILYNDYMERTDSRPSEAKAHIIGELNKAINSCLSITIYSFGNVQAGKGTFYFTKKDTPYPFDYNVLSSGEKEVLDLLLDLYLRKEEYNDSIYIIDEPELHLNTAIQRKLLVEINKMIPENCQIWIATHSIGFLRALQDELKDQSQIIEFKAENKWAAQEYVLTPAKSSRKMWQEVFSTALDDLTSLVAPKRIVYCEGKAEPKRHSEEQGMDAAVFNTIFNEKYPDTLFISSGGNTELDQRSDIAIAILSKVFSDIAILVLKDRDMGSGKEIDEAQRQLYFQNNPLNHRVLKRFEIENYLYDKEVLKKYCQTNGLSFDEETYDKQITDIYNQHVKECTGLIKNICGINGSVNAESFKKNLATYIDETMNVYKELEQVIFHRK